MSVHYKFKSELRKWDTITFDSAVISVLDLKRAIVAQQISDVGAKDFDLVITNAQTGERYTAENFLIPKNTSVEVKRVPASQATIMRIRQPPEVTILSNSVPIGASTSSGSPTNEDEEARRMESVLNQAPAYGASSRARSGGIIHDLSAAYAAPAPLVQPAAPPAPQRGGPTRPQFPRASKPKVGYICHRCHAPGHFIQECPTNGNTEFNFNRPKPITGIPISMLKPTGDGRRGAYQMQDGTFADIEPNHRAFDEAFHARDHAEKVIAQEAASSAERLFCQLCRLLFTDPVATPCCFTTYCQACIRQSILSTSQLTCPFCGEAGINPDDLKPNLAVAKAVSAYKQQQGTAQSVPQLVSSQAMPQVNGHLSSSLPSSAAAQPPPQYEQSHHYPPNGSNQGQPPPPPPQHDDRHPPGVAPIYGAPHPAYHQPEPSVPTRAPIPIFESQVPCATCRGHGHSTKDCPTLHRRSSRDDSSYAPMRQSSHRPEPTSSHYDRHPARDDRRPLAHRHDDRHDDRRPPPDRRLSDRRDDRRPPERRDDRRYDDRRDDRRLPDHRRDDHRRSRSPRSRDYRGGGRR